MRQNIQASAKHAIKVGFFSLYIGGAGGPACRQLVTCVFSQREVQAVSQSGVQASTEGRGPAHKKRGNKADRRGFRRAERIVKARRQRCVQACTQTESHADRQPGVQATATVSSSPFLSRRARA
eukprot:2083724-Pleurochrysis_carterae.AAC.5